MVLVVVAFTVYVSEENGHYDPVVSYRFMMLVQNGLVVSSGFP